VLTWLGDDVNEAIVCMLRFHGFDAALAGPFVEVQKGGSENEDILAALTHDIQSESVTDLFSKKDNLLREKWDWALPETLLRKSYLTRYLDLAGAVAWAATHQSAGSHSDD
jgi:ATP-dependent helicase Lhr and Lhr-like helicase